jgi:hypothetical protein
VQASDHVVTAVRASGAAFVLMFIAGCGKSFDSYLGKGSGVLAVIL